MYISSTAALLTPGVRQRVRANRTTVRNHRGIEVIEFVPNEPAIDPLARARHDDDVYRVFSRQLAPSHR